MSKIGSEYQVKRDRTAILSLCFFALLPKWLDYFFNSLTINNKIINWIIWLISICICQRLAVVHQDSINHKLIPPRLFYRIFIWFTSFSTFCTQIEKQEVTSFFEFIDIYQFIAYNKDVKSGQIILFRILGLIKNYLVLRKLR